MRKRERETGNSKKSTRLRSKNYPFDDWCKSSICAVASLVCFELATCVFIYIVCDDIMRRDILYICTCSNVHEAYRNTKLCDSSTGSHSGQLVHHCVHMTGSQSHSQAAPAFSSPDDVFLNCCPQTGLLELPICS